MKRITLKERSIKKIMTISPELSERRAEHLYDELKRMRKIEYLRKSSYVMMAVSFILLGIFILTIVNI